MSQSVTTAFAGIKNYIELGLDTPAESVKVWVESEFTKGRALHQRFLDNGHTVRIDLESDPCQVGFAFDEAWSHDPADEWLDENNAAATAARYSAHLAEIRAESDATADALIADASKSSMQPLMEHYASDALLEAYSVLESYGSINSDGEFSPYLVVDFGKLARDLAVEHGQNPGWAMDKKILPLIKTMIDDKADIARVALQLSINSDPELHGERFERIAGTVEMLFVSMPEYTKAARKGEAVWAMLYLPKIRRVTNDRTGEISYWSNSYKGEYLGTCRTFASYEAGKEAAVELAQALRTIRDADAERVHADFGGTTADIDERSPITRPPQEAAF